MSKRGVVCVLSDAVATRNCGDGSHEHISHGAAYCCVDEGLLEWVKKPTLRGDKGIARLLLPARELQKSGGMRSSVCGAYLAGALRRRCPWAQVALADMARPEDRPAFLRAR